MAKEKYAIYDLDVWADGEDGWDINDYIPLGEIEVDFTDDYTKDNGRVLVALMNRGLFLSDVTEEDLQFDWDELGCLVLSKDGYPLFSLRKKD